MRSRDCNPAVIEPDARSIVPAVRWCRSFRQARLHQPDLQGNAAFWLQVEGSLTRHLQLRCRESFHVEVANEGFSLPTREEALTLDIPHRQRAWIREVRLCGDGRPWVLARTIIPLATLNGRGRRLRHLGRIPLGAWLFSHREWSRGPLQAGLCRGTGPDTPRCARRSIFSSDNHRLLVGEYFLPELLTQPL
ncbi:chorismate--pyruvate lyase family protein [Marinobacter sp. OP 3.4]|uniref:chorismate--pyruvate lyase family protein n=1 Tax=Marinobacter sp. OP 3.4 TaxID=3076501 RepID=UPI002E1F0F36